MIRRIVIGLIEFYATFLSFDRGALALFAPGGACRQDPTCSVYTKQKVKQHGVWAGLKMGFLRIWRCR